MQFSVRDGSHTDLIDLVRPLVFFISQEVPEYCRTTNNLPQRQSHWVLLNPETGKTCIHPTSGSLWPASRRPKGNERPDELAVR